MQAIKLRRIAPLIALAAAVLSPAAAQTTAAPNFVIGYSVQPLNNAVVLTNGATIAFPASQVGATATGALIIGNSGNAAGVLTSVVVTGAAFNTQNLPLLPVTMGPGVQASIPLIYTPTQVGADSGTVTVTAGGQTRTFNLSGTGISGPFQFQVSEAGQTIAVTPLSAIPMPDTAVGATSTINVAITNTGSSPATLSTINLSGAAYQIIGTLPLPFTLLPGGSANIAFSFTPTQPGANIGSLTIGSAAFSLAGRGLGPLYRYSYGVGSTSTPINSGATIFFPQGQVGQTSIATFTITNAGTATASIGGIFISSQTSPFALAGVPAFPLVLAPGAAASFQITYTPTAVGGQQASLVIDGAQFTLSGSGAPLPAFPSYSLSGPSGSASNLQQVPITLSIASPYPLPIQGSLAVVDVPQGFSADPAVQFSTGGKTAAFTIPANSTSAVFANGSTTVKLQTGSTAGTITLTPSFQTSGGGSTVTPSGGSPLVFTIPAAAPVIIGAQVSSSSPTSITVAITGVTNTETLSQIAVQLSPASGYSLKSTSVTIPVSAAATAFFASAAAASFGGQFVASVPFTFTAGGTVPSALTLIKSMSITVTNDQGASPAYVLNLQ